MIEVPGVFFLIMFVSTGVLAMVGLVKLVDSLGDYYETVKHRRLVREDQDRETQVLIQAARNDYLNLADRVRKLERN